MEIKNKTVLVLGGYGEVGIAICRQILTYTPKKLIVSSLKEKEALEAVRELSREAPGSTTVIPFFGNLFVRLSMKDLTQTEITSSEDLLKRVVEDNLHELDSDILTSSTLYHVITENKPHIIIDCLTTATALSYVNVYRAFDEIEDTIERHPQRIGQPQAIYRIFSAVSMPPLVRHMQILYESMKKSGTQLYLKIGTTGTGGMGFNIPFTHGEKSPSRLLMTKTAIAGAQTMLIFAFNRIPGWPVMKEIKPAAMIGWKSVDSGRIERRGKPVLLYDCPFENAYQLKVGKTFQLTKFKPSDTSTTQEMEGVYIDTGENGLFSPDEFKIVTSLGLMEFVTPEEIGHTVIMNILGVRGSDNVIDAIESSVMNPGYRAGVLRQYALKFASSLGDAGISYGFLGPLISKLIFEAHLLRLCFETAEGVLQVSPNEVSRNLEKRLRRDTFTRRQAISIGIPILLADGERLLFVRRHMQDKEWEEMTWQITKEKIDHYATRQWIDLRPLNMAKWQRIFQKLLRQNADFREDKSSRPDRGRFFWERNTDGKIVIDAGEVAAWVLIHEHGGGRIDAYITEGGWFS